MNRLFCSFLGVFLAILADAVPAGAARPVILDTDICDDIDDTWALALLLKSPELDCKLVVTAVGDTQAKARIVARFLAETGRADIPVGVGVKQGKGPHRQMGWVKDYDLASYPGKVHPDGVQALIDVIMNSPTRVTLIAVGPLPNVAEALRREPRIAEKADFIGMHGSVFVGYGGSSTPHAEYNVVKDVPAAKKVFTAPWPMTITPLDTCGLVELDGPKYQSLLKNDSVLVRNLLENYRQWYLDGLQDRKDLDEAGRKRVTEEKLRHSSTTLFDTVAIYLAVSKDLVEMKEVPIRVTDDGFTRVEEGAKKVNCAVKWKDLDGFEAWLVERLTKN
ncbi:MAG TPA: nucleoside hydrolase [Sedimentisphaerales bacterium]|nr:nucleoside hydrolase [Sedimentisphaerales bacterium]